MPVVIPHESNFYGFPGGIELPKTVEELNAIIDQHGQFEDRRVKANMEYAIGSIHSDLLNYVVPTYVKHADKFKPEEERPSQHSILGVETRFLEDHIDRNGDNIAGIDQNTAERIVRQIQRISFAAKILLERRAQLPQDMHDFEQQQLLETHRGRFGSDGEHEKIDKAQKDLPQPVLYLRGEKVDIDDMAPTHYADMSLSDMATLKIPELRNMIAMQIGKIEKALPKDLHISAQLRAIEAIANYEIEAPGAEDNFELFRYDVPDRHKDTIRAGVEKMIRGVSAAEMTAMHAEDSPETKAHHAIALGSYIVSDKAKKQIVEEQEARLTPKDAVAVRKMKEILRAQGIVPKHRVEAQTVISTTGQRILFVSLAKNPGSKNEEAQREIIQLFDKLGFPKESLDQSAVPDGIVLGNPAGVDNIDRLIAAIDNEIKKMGR